MSLLGTSAAGQNFFGSTSRDCNYSNCETGDASGSQQNENDDNREEPTASLWDEQSRTEDATFSLQAERSGYERRYGVLREYKNQEDRETPAFDRSDVRTTSSSSVKADRNWEKLGRGHDHLPKTAVFREPPTEFQRQVHDSTQKWLRIYGQDLFRHVPSTFAPLDHVPVPPEYTVGPGDELQIRAWGQIEMKVRTIVDRNGEIFLPQVGVIGIAGTRRDQLEPYLRAQIGRIFRNFELNVNLGKLRSIQILVVGAARRPGSYTIGGFSTLVNAIFASGGPAANGSLRCVELRRQGNLVVQFDLYDLLIQGDATKDVPIHGGDIIFIPPVGSLVAVTGSVNQPAIYELRDESQPQQLIAIAGGISALGDPQKIRVDSLAERTGTSHPPEGGLRNGDIITVSRRAGSFEHTVALRGNVSLPGLYPWRPGMRVRDLLPSREALITSTYLAFFKRLGSRGKQIDELGENSRISYPRKNSENPRNSPGMELSSARESGGFHTEASKVLSEVNWDYAIVQRLDDRDLSTKIIPFNLGKVMDEPVDSPENLELQDHDVITIFAQRDLEVPDDKRSKVIRIEGEVRIPGVYTANAGETLRDLVVRAGGLTPSAYLFASDFRRQRTQREQQKQIEQMVDAMDKELQARAAAPPKTNAEDRAADQEQLAAQRNLLANLRKTQATGRVVLEIQPSDTSILAIPVVSLEDGDRLLVPSRPSTVGVVGAVYNQNTFLFKEGKTVQDYLQQSGGGTRSADGKRLFIVRADGSVLSKQMHRGLWKGRFESTRLMPGDSIVMPERIRASSFMRGIRDWSQVFSQFALGAAAVRVVSP
jgi:protein involved in polysaccharide export with SLBB domain